MTLDNVVAFENQTFAYTAHMDYASLTPFTVTLNNGVNITFAAGQLYPHRPDLQPAQGEDVYLDGQATQVSDRRHLRRQFRGGELLNLRPTPRLRSRTRSTR